MISSFKVTSWNVAHLDRLMEGVLTASKAKRREAIAREIREIDADVLCVIEGPRAEAKIDHFCHELLNDDYVAVKAPDGRYDTLGTQWVWFLVRNQHAARASLLPTSTWDAFAKPEWPVNYWGVFEPDTHQHYRHPQVLVLDWNGLRVEFVGLHLKSKFVNDGERMWKVGGEQQKQFIQEALKARVKMTTEAANVRAYIDARFAQNPNPAIFVMGDLNDGPGKELFERQYLFFDLVSNLQGDVFFASKFLNHALFDYSEEHRWRRRLQRLRGALPKPAHPADHIMFTQTLVNGSLPWRIDAKAGLVEHEVHDLINATLTSTQKTSDHKPVSCNITLLS
jgi:endonuclease/exonuclease/phosphatase family metal-dependent hydrolase